MPAEQKYHITEQELLVVIEAPKAFWNYVDGIPFTLVTHTYSASTYVQLKLHWEYRPGRTNVADPLSRNPSYRPATSPVAHAVRAQLCVTIR